MRRLLAGPRSAVAAIFVVFPPLCAATLLASSEIQHCVRTSPTEPPPCDKQFVVALTVDGGQGGTEEVAFISTAKGTDGRKYNVTPPIRVTVAKEMPLIRYPIYYHRDYNGRPSERIVGVSELFGCADSPGAENPTCGVAKVSAEGEPLQWETVPFSQGFCCKCELCAVLGICAYTSRANTDCSLKQSGAAHCIDWDALWYSGYEIGPAETWFWITVTVQQEGKDPEKLMLGPTSLSAKSELGEVRARLVGDFAPFVEPFNLQGHRLLVPSRLASRDHPRAQVRGISEWLLLEKLHFADDGRMCDRIGVSYEGFATQPGRCGRAGGSCLANQPLDFREADEEREAEGRKAKHSVTSFGDFALYSASASRRMAPLEAPAPPRRGRPAAAPTSEYLAYEVTRLQASLLTLTFPADSLKFTINVARGHIVGANVSAFEAGSADGELLVTVANTGEVAGDFEVAVNSCHGGAVPTQAQTRTIQPGQHLAFRFKLRTPVAVSDSDHSCTVELRDALYDTVDEGVINFTAAATEVRKGAQAGNMTVNGEEYNEEGDAEDSGSCTDCPWYSPICFLVRKCFLQVVIRIAFITGLVCLCLCAFKLGWFGRLYDCVRTRCRGKRDPPPAEDEEEEEEEEEEEDPSPRRRRRRTRGGERSGSRSARGRSPRPRSRDRGREEPTEPTELTQSSESQPSEPPRREPRRSRGKRRERSPRRSPDPERGRTGGAAAPRSRSRDRSPRQPGTRDRRRRGKGEPRCPIDELVAAAAGSPRPSASPRSPARLHRA